MHLDIYSWYTPNAPDFQAGISAVVESQISLQLLYVEKVNEDSAIHSRSVQSASRATGQSGHLLTLPAAFHNV